VSIPAPDLEVQPVLLVQLGERLDDPKGGANRALRVVLVRGGCAEHGHRRVADELLERATPPVDLPAEEGVVGPEDGSDVLGIGAVGA
jgi:hypothetical protein